MQFRDLKAQYQALKPEIDEGIQAVIDSSAFILGKPVTELENKLAEYVGRKHCVACGNGTDALQLALMIWVIIHMLVLMLFYATELQLVIMLSLAWAQQ